MAFKGPTRGFASRTRVQVTGLDDVVASMRRLGKAGLLVGKRVFDVKTEEMVRRARPLTPDDPETAGLLRDTVRKIRPIASSTKGRVTGGIMAGGKELEQRLGGREYSAWALVQHEDVTLHHSSGQAKFLEIPFMQIVPSIPEALRMEVDAEAANATR